MRLRPTASFSVAKQLTLSHALITMACLIGCWNSPAPGFAASKKPPDLTTGRPSDAGFRHRFKYVVWIRVVGRTVVNLDDLMFMIQDSLLQTYGDSRPDMDWDGGRKQFFAAGNCNKGECDVVMISLTANKVALEPAVSWRDGSALNKDDFHRPPELSACNLSEDRVVERCRHQVEAAICSEITKHTARHIGVPPPQNSASFCAYKASQ